MRFPALVSALLLLPAVALAQHHGHQQAEPPEPVAADTTHAKDDKEDAKWDVDTADLGPETRMQKTVTEGTWMSLDVSPDGTTIVFDLLGDIYTLPLAGGTATRIRGGKGYDVHPRYSPDGDWISFTTDAGGGDNIWVMRADGTGARQVTTEDYRLLNNAVWTPDGRYLIAKKHFTSRRSLGAGEMWLYDLEKPGSGVQLTEKPTDQKDVGEPEVSPDGRYLYYSLDSTPGSSFEYNKDPYGTIYTIRRLDRVTGDSRTEISVDGGSVRPEISPDGTRLAYVRRARLKTLLMVRDLETGQDTPLWDGLSQDSQETWAVHGVYPNYGWTPDGKSLVIWAHGKLWRVDASGAGATEIPFRADLDVAITDVLRFSPDLGGDSFPVRVIRWPRVSPNGKTVVFQALGQLWTRPLAGGAPKQLTQGDEFAFYPVWTPDGSRIVYSTWDDLTGGKIRSVAAAGGAERAIVTEPGHYSELDVSRDGKWVVYKRGGGDRYRGGAFTTETGIYVAPLSGGTPRRITEHGDAPRFDASGERILLFEWTSDKKTLYSVDLLGGDRRNLVTSERAMDLSLSPDGNWIAFQELWEVYVAPRPDLGRPLAVGPGMKNLPVRKVSRVSGEFLSWSPDSKILSFGLGPDLYRMEVAPYLSAPDSVAKTMRPDSLALGWNAKRDIPGTDVALVGATVLTMADPPVIENAAVRVRGNRIVAVGPRADVDITGAKVIDVSGKVLLPGYVDVHAHTGSSNDDLHAEQNWAFLANLSFGVTTTHDPSNNTRMIFGSSELVQSGRVLGPRVFSTGTILYGAEGEFKSVTNSLDDARQHLKRLKAYGAWSAKSYNQPRREQRQWYVKAGRELDMMIVPEGGSFYNHNMSMFMDGHTTLEHAVPIAPLYDDALSLMAESGTAYTPTLVVGYGGLWGENYWYQHTNVWENNRLLRWVPRSVVDPRSRRRVMAPEGDFHHIDIARGAAEVFKRGGIVEVGAHGQMQGIGVHWELWMFEQGGLTPLEALEVATLGGAQSLGLDSWIGSIQEGKLADLIVLGSDPREDLRRSEDVDLVMINGRLFDARTLDQIAPAAVPLPKGPELNSIPLEMLQSEGCVHP